MAVFPLAGPALDVRVQHELVRIVSRTVENDVLLLLVQVGLILGLSRIMGVLFARMRQPQVVGEMAAGIMLGPSVLGVGWPRIQAMVFPPGPSLTLLNILSELGVIFFLFLVGLEFEFGLVRDRGRATIAIALSSIAVPFALGAGVAMVLSAPSIGLFGQSPRLPAALFVGAAMSITAFPVLARILTERNLQKTRIGAGAIAAAAINDLAAWVILAFVVAVAHSAVAGGGTGGALRTVALSAAFAAVMFLIVRPFLRRLRLIYDRQGRLSQNVVAVIFLLILASAWATERIGIHAMFGAFLLGVVMPKGTEFVRHITEKLEDFAVVFLLPIFFAYTGLRTRLGLLDSPSLILFTLVILAAACLGKFGGAAGAARIFGSSWREATAIGILMNTRGLVELVILSVGLQFGVINERVFAMMVIMALVTTFMTTPLLHWIRPPRSETEPSGETDSASATAKPFTVLVPIAAPASAAPLLRMADMLGGSDPRPRIYALRLRRPADRPEFRSGLRESRVRGDEVLTDLTARAEAEGISIRPLSFISRDIAGDIARTARDRQADLVLMGFHKPVFSRSLLGGTVHRVLTAAAADVAVFVNCGFSGTRNVLVPYLGSPHDRLAMQLAGRLARNAKAQVTILHVTRPRRTEPPLDARAAVDRVFNDPSQPLPVQMRVVESDDPAGTVVEQAKEFDLVVIGVAEEWGLASHLFGWRSERIAAQCPTSLLIVRRFARPDPEELRRERGMAIERAAEAAG